MPKKITTNQQTGRTGEVFVGYVFQRLGQIWHESKSDAGIDCHVEWRDPATGVTSNRHIGVQVKAYSGAFQNETDSHFEYMAKVEDIDYWMSGTMPVILVCCKPQTQQAYWTSIRDEFSDPIKRRSRKITFDKGRQKLDENALNALEKLALPESVGLYLEAPPKSEILYTNLVKVERKPKEVHVGESDLAKRAQVFACLRDAGVENPAGEFICRDKSIISVHDLRKEPWCKVVEKGTVETLGFDEWWHAENGKRKGYAVELLNHCLTAFFADKGVRWRASDEVYFVKSNSGQREISLKSRGLHRETTSHVVFRAYLKKKSPDVSFCRHHAMRARFHEIEGSWFLEINPTYRFSRDGWKDDLFAAERLKKIKEFEGNPGIFSNAFMWSEMLTSTVADFWHREYPHLSFGGLLSISASKGIPDEAWRSSSSESKTMGEEQWDNLLEL